MAAKESDTVLEEEAALMAEVLVDGMVQAWVGHFVSSITLP
jgi:hypothetical protein